ncbi:hypothetical protein RRG08_050233 [Elysia crispata]|uniref:Uncharacterized protein n=1 Tax=Elysia crispata TaxID=231223 RepID=A0AAE1EAI1_9GAST|nr:hypothetical protein RRG08_050233 [Elysia crispata]
MKTNTKLDETDKDPLPTDTMKKKIVQSVRWAQKRDGKTKSRKNSAKQGQCRTAPISTGRFYVFINELIEGREREQLYLP